MTQQSSPILKNKVEIKMMTFLEALKEVIDGKKITKQEWRNKAFYGEFKDGFLKLHKPDGKYYQWIISEGDLVGDDYIVVEDGPIN